MKSDKKKTKINPVMAIGLIFGVILLGLLIYSVYKMLRGNPYGEEIRIDNFSSYFSDTPEDTRYALFAGLYGIVSENAEANGVVEIPHSGAMLRDGSVKNDYNKEQNMHFGTFIVDIAELGQSYSGYFEWSNDEKNTNFSGYRNLYTCLDEDELIYNKFICKDMFSGTNAIKFPISRELPFTVEYYSDDYSKYTKYYLSYELDDDDGKESIILRITDYTGGNYEAALTKIRSLGYEPTDFEIVYEDVSADYGWKNANY